MRNGEEALDGAAFEVVGNRLTADDGCRLVEVS